MRKPGKPAHALGIPHLVVLIVAALVIPLVISGFVWAKKGVMVVVNGQSTYCTTKAETVSEVLDEMHIALTDADVVSPLPGARVFDGDEIVVLKATSVTLECNGTATKLQVVGTTVADALVTAGLDPSVGLAVSPSTDTSLSADMTITATDVFMRVAQEQAAIPFQTVEQQDPTLPAGKRLVVQSGVNGQAMRVYEVLVVGEVETTKTVKTEQVLSEPVAQIVRVGTRVAGATTLGRTAACASGADAAAKPPQSGTKMLVRATAYTPWDPGCGGLSVIERRIAAYNIPDGWGVVAVDPGTIPIGTRVYVPGYGYAVAADTGGGISGFRIDVCYWDGGSVLARRAALAWGSRSVTITILE